MHVLLWTGGTRTKCLINYLRAVLSSILVGVCVVCMPSLAAESLLQLCTKPSSMKHACFVYYVWSVMFLASSVHSSTRLKNETLNVDDVLHPQFWTVICTFTVLSRRVCVLQSKFTETFFNCLGRQHKSTLCVGLHRGVGRHLHEKFKCINDAISINFLQFL